MGTEQNAKFLMIWMNISMVSKTLKLMCLNQAKG